MQTEKYLYPIPDQRFESLTEWLHEVRASTPVPCTWDDEEKRLWIKNLWFACWFDVQSYIERNRLWDRLFGFGIGKWWSANGNCTMAERAIQ